MLHSIRISDEALQLLRKYRHIGQSYDGFIKELLQEHGVFIPQGSSLPSTEDMPSSVDAVGIKE